MVCLTHVTSFVVEDHDRCTRPHYGHIAGSMNNLLSIFRSLDGNFKDPFINATVHTSKDKVKGAHSLVILIPMEALGALQSMTPDRLSCAWWIQI